MYCESRLISRYIKYAIAFENSQQEKHLKLNPETAIRHNDHILSKYIVLIG